MIRLYVCQLCRVFVLLCLQLEENEKQMNEMKQSWEQKLKDAHDALKVFFYC